MKIHFEDRGQDLLWWKLDSTGRIIDCGPFQADFWIDNIVCDHGDLQVADHPTFISKIDGEWLTLNYKITKIDQVVA